MLYMHLNIHIHTQQAKPASQPWQYTDGAIYLARELCSVAPAVGASLLPALIEVTRLTHFPQADTLRETLFKAVPRMAVSVGKTAFKPHLQELLQPLFATLTRPTTHQLAGYAAVDCVQALSAFMGPGIFMGRLSAEQAAVMQRLPVAATAATCTAQVCVCILACSYTTY
jgi:hypothetical protein